MAKPHAPRFIRLAAPQLEVLFGAGTALRPRIEISGGRFVARERVALVGRSGRLEGVAVVGPIEEHVTVRLSPGDLERLGLDNGGLLVVGPQGEVRITEGIVAT